MMAERKLRAAIDERLHRFGRVHVLVAHEPARLIGADRQDGELEWSVALARVAEMHGPLRLAILPIGAYEPRWFMKDQHMNPSDAVMALGDCGAQAAVANHHGTFQLTDEAIDAPVTALHAALDEAKISREKFVALKPGQVFEI